MDGDLGDVASVRWTSEDVDSGVKKLTCSAWVNYKSIFPSPRDILQMPLDVMSATKPSLVFVLASNQTVDREGSLITSSSKYGM